MKAEIRFADGGMVVVVTDCITGQKWEFGPYGFDEAQAILRNSDKQRELVKAAK